MNLSALIDRHVDRVLFEAASGSGDLPLAPLTKQWDGDGASERLAKWASSDGSGAPDKIDWGKYRKGFFWYDSEKPENVASFKLPFADVFGGGLKAVWSGISAVAGVLSGARGVVKGIPEADLKAIKGKVRTYYRRFEKGKPSFDRVEETTNVLFYLCLPGLPANPLVEGKLTPRQLRFLFAMKYAQQKGQVTVGQAGTPLGKQLAFTTPGGMLRGIGLQQTKGVVRQHLGLAKLGGPKAAAQAGGSGAIRKIAATHLQKRLLAQDERHDLLTRGKGQKPRQLALKTTTKTSTGGAVKSTFFSNDSKHDYQASGTLGMRQYLLAAHKGRKLEAGFENFSPNMVRARFLATVKAKHGFGVAA